MDKPPPKEVKKKLPEVRKGKRHSLETRAKMSQAQKGNTNRLGRKHTDETKAKMSKAHKGRKHTPEAKAKIARAKMGNTNAAGLTPSLETRAKIARAKFGNTYTLGFKHTEESRAKMAKAQLGNTKGKARIGTRLPVEVKIKLAKAASEGRIGAKFTKRPKYISKSGQQITFRSSWEYKVATWMDSQGWTWEYELGPIVAGNDVYLPDFVVLDENKSIKIVEVKGWFPKEAQEKLIRIQGAISVPLEIWDQQKLKQLGIL